MARGRMIAKSLSTSQKYAALNGVAGKLAEFCQALFPLLVAHSDDFGRLPGDEFTVKHLVFPTSPRKLFEFSEALSALSGVGLVLWYEVGSRKYLQIVNFDKHQPGLHRRTKSEYPPPPEGTPALDASEQEIESFIAAELESGRLNFGLSVTSVDRQVRVGQSYLDIVARTVEGPTLLFEVKRQRVTNAAIQQVLDYRLLLAQKDAIPVVIGCGLAADLETSGRGVVIGTYDGASQTIQMVAPTYIDVIAREITFTHIPSEEKRTEEKRTEEKRTEGKRTEGSPSDAADAAPPPLRPSDVAAIWNEQAEGTAIPSIQAVTGNREATLRARIREHPDPAWWRAYVERVHASDFLAGRTPGKDGQAPFRATFDWVLKPANMAKILEGNYDRRAGPANAVSSLTIQNMQTAGRVLARIKRGNHGES